MKKVVIMLMFCTYAMCANAQSVLEGLLNSTLDKNSITSIIENVVGDAVSKLDLSIEGTWRYSEPEVQFKSENFLAEAGGSLVSSSVEKTLSKVYDKVGVNSSFTYTFNADSTFTQTIKIGSSVKNLKGTYSLDKENNIIVLNYALFGKVNLGKMSAIYANTGTSLALMFDSSEMFGFLKKIVSTAGSLSGRAGLATISGVVDKYDGMLQGLKLKR